MAPQLTITVGLLVMSQKGGDKLGYEAEAFAIYDTMRYIKPPIGTVCVGNAFGEAGMLLAAGEPVSPVDTNAGLDLCHEVHGAASRTVVPTSVE